MRPYTVTSPPHSPTQGSPNLLALGLYWSGPVRNLAAQQEVSLNVMSLNYPETIRPTWAHGKIIFHENRTWCQKGWRLLPQSNYYLYFWEQSLVCLSHTILFEYSCFHLHFTACSYRSVYSLIAMKYPQSFILKYFKPQKSWKTSTMNTQITFTKNMKKYYYRILPCIMCTVCPNILGKNKDVHYTWVVILYLCVFNSFIYSLMH